VARDMADQPAAAVTSVQRERPYLVGFANEFATEARVGALPRGQNSPQKPPLGLVSELVSGTAFSAPRALNRRSYLFRIRPSTLAGPWEPLEHRTLLSAPVGKPRPAPLRWAPVPLAPSSQDFLDGLFTICANGSAESQSGSAIHLFSAGRSMSGRAFANADGDMLLIPYAGSLLVVTELGILEVAVGEFALIPRGMKFRVDLLHGQARGVVCENYGVPFVLPELGPIGSHGLANAIDFKAPVAAFEEVTGTVELVQKFCGNLWRTALDHSPFDVVAWRGNWTPLKYSMRDFATMGTLSVDHPDPSIYCALTSPSHDVAGGNLDFMILPPRWVVAERTFRPPGFHRNCVAEVLGLIDGSSESRAGGFPPGSISLHNNWTPHGPDTAAYDAARDADLRPEKIEETLMFMVESRFPFAVASQALDADFRIKTAGEGWAGFAARFPDSE
jgi:homogentisate 1,2-dioxygenase